MLSVLKTALNETLPIRLFLVGFIVSLIMSLSGNFSIFSWLATFICLTPYALKLNLLEDKFSYDTRQQILFNSVLFSSLLWCVFCWTTLQEKPLLFYSTATILALTFLLVQNKTSYILAGVLPLLLSIVVLITYFSNNPQYIISVMLLASFAVWTYYKTLTYTQELKQKPSKELKTSDKLSLISELDVAKIENQKLVDKIKQIEIDLSAAEMAKMEFLATMSHEIRTPLNGIIPLLDILLDSELSDFQKDYLSTAHISAIQMQKLIDDLLDYSRVEAGKLSVETRGLKIPRILEAVHSSFKQAAEKKNIALEVNVHKNVSPLLRGDPTRLRQVLSNLVSNAIKFSSIGKVLINAKKIKDYPNKEVVRFEVIDKGIGLDKETCENIFLAFTQEDASSTRKFGGTGLGLAISKKIVELMHGTIAVESTKGKGSNFYFDLPLLKSVGETSVGLTESSDYKAILINTNPLLFNKISQKIKAEDIPFQKALGLPQAYEIYASINKVSKNTKKVLVFLDFETAGKQVRSLCQDLSTDPMMSNMFACILSENTSIAGIPIHDNIKILAKDESIAELLNKLEVLQAGLDAKIPSQQAGESTHSPSQVPDEEVVKTLLPEVLLVEDNEVNLKVAEKLIQYIGYPFDYAMNGQEALEKVKQNRYRMILMDCQMPVMDGYRSTKSIREYEEAAGLNRTPILAMTANAMMGDREKCLDAGMDDYMSKPLNRYILEKTLKKWDPLVNVKTSEIQAKSTTISTETPKEPIKVKKKPLDKPPQQITINQKWLDIKVLVELKEIMGDEMIQLLDMFEKETPNILAQIEEALKTKNYNDVRKMAHMLKSTSANIGAKGLSFFSRQLELTASKENLNELVGIYKKIKKSKMLTSHEIKKYKQMQE